jgi:hypothetical protein
MSILIVLVYAINDSAKRREVKKSNRKETRYLTWKTPSTREGKNHGC